MHYVCNKSLCGTPAEQKAHLETIPVLWNRFGSERKTLPSETHQADKL
jgi:hypothetical protein